MNYEVSKTAEAPQKGFRILSVFKNVFIALILTVIFVMVYALVITYTSIGEGGQQAVIMIAALLSILTAGILSSRGARKNGWLNGLVAGLIYMGILYLTGFLAFGEVGFTKQTLTMLLLGALCGATGGVLGINMKKKRKK